MPSTKDIEKFRKYLNQTFRDDFIENMKKEQSAFHKAEETTLEEPNETVSTNNFDSADIDQLRVDFPSEDMQPDLSTLIDSVNKDVDPNELHFDSKQTDSQEDSDVKAEMPTTEEADLSTFLDLDWTKDFPSDPVNGDGSDEEDWSLSNHEFSNTDSVETANVPEDNTDNLTNDSSLNLEDASETVSASDSDRSQPAGFFTSGSEDNETPVDIDWSENLFETPAPEEHSLQKFSQVPNPFIIEAPICQVRFYQPGDCLSFSVVLIGHAIRQLPLVIFALKKGFEYNIAHGTAMLQKVDHINTKGKAICIYHAEDRSIVEHETFITCPSFSHVDEINLRFETHLRLQKNGVVLGAKEINPHAFLNALVRRIALLSEFHMKKPLSLDFSKLSALAETVQWEKDFQWRDWQRYSSRQKRTMHLGGLLGQCRFKKLPSEFLPFLYLGQWFHMGKNATFGLGKFQIGVKSDEK